MPITTTLNCDSLVLGTGTRGCRAIKTYIERRFLIEKGYKLDKSLDTLDETTVQDLIQKGILVPLPVNLGAEPNHAEPTYETIQKQDIFVSGTVYKWKLQYNADRCLARALASLASKSWDLLEVDEDGFLNAVETADGFIKGFDLNMVRFEGMKDNDGTAGAKNTLVIQLSKIGSKEYASQWTTIAPDEVNWLSLQGVDEILFTKTADGKLKATFACDGSSAITGLTTSNVKAFDSTGAAVAGFAIADAGNGTYTVTGLTTPGDYKIYTYDSTANARTIVLADYFYKSNELRWTA